jgi:hypothetical protein
VGPLATSPDIRRHVGLKRGAHEMRDEVADRLLSLLDDAGPAPDYAALLRAATFPDPPPIVWHTAPTFARQEIERSGLRTSAPGTSDHWQPRAGTPCANGFLDDQPRAVYVAATPDIHGLWSHWPAWDVWQVTLGNLPWTHDEVNPGCWAITKHVPASRVNLLYRKSQPL